jgi:hypothetical protein
MVGIVVLLVAGESVHQYTRSPRKPDDTTQERITGDGLSIVNNMSFRLTPNLSDIHANIQNVEANAMIAKGENIIQQLINGTGNTIINNIIYHNP